MDESSSSINIFDTCSRCFTPPQGACCSLEMTAMAVICDEAQGPASVQVFARVDIWGKRKMEDMEVKVSHSVQASSLAQH